MTIDKGIPLPSDKWHEHNIDLDKMEVKDSFFIDDHVSRIRSRVKAWRDKHYPDNEKNFSTRIWNQDGKHGTRVWRTK